MAEVVQKNNNQNKNGELAQERIIVRSDGVTGKQVACLDRVDHVTHQPVLGIYNEKANSVENNGIKDYRVEAESPYRISDIKFPVFAPQANRDMPEPTYKKIVAIDSTTEDIRVGAYASHYKMVETVLEHDKQFEVKGFDVGVPGNSQSINYGKYLEVLKHLDKDYEWGPIKVVNMSFVNQVSFDEINVLMNKHYNVQKGFSITKENIAEHSEGISHAVLLESQSKSADAARFSDVITEIELLKSLMSKGVTVVMSAGNSGEKMFDIRAAMLPDIVVVGGLDESGKFVDNRSANNSTIDSWEPFTTKYEISGVPVTLEGTSFSAPLTARKVADMQGFAKARDIPLSVQDINKELHRETVQKFSRK